MGMIASDVQFVHSEPVSLDPSDHSDSEHVDTSILLTAESDTDSDMEATTPSSTNNKQQNNESDNEQHDQKEGSMDNTKKKKKLSDNPYLNEYKATPNGEDSDENNSDSEQQINAKQQIKNEQNKANNIQTSLFYASIAV